MPRPELLLRAEAGSTDIWAIANAPFLWICAIGVFVVIAVQTVLYLRAARVAAPGIEMPMAEVKESFRAGAVASIGPSLAVVLVAISLLALFGTPAVLVRIGLIGSAATETSSAGIAANSMGAELGSSDYTQQVFVVALFAMTMSGCTWMLATLIFTPILRRGSATLAKRNPAVMALVPSAALLAAFSSLAVAELTKGMINVGAALVSAIVMTLCLYLAKVFKARWLKEWGLGISIIVALAAAYLMHTGM